MNALITLRPCSAGQSADYVELHLLEIKFWSLVAQPEADIPFCLEVQHERQQMFHFDISFFINCILYP